MLWKSLLVASLLIIDSGVAVAKARYVQDPVAVRYRKGSIFDGDIRSKELSPTSWQINSFGTNVTSGERLAVYTNLRLALMATKKGFSHFAFTPEKKSVLCRNRLMGRNVATPYIIGVVTFANAGQTGYVDAKAYVAAHAASLLADAPAAEKSAVFADWSGRCNNR
ncbi:MAG: hypothetical protein ACKVP5_10110 [Aestuariivirga sp.]